MPANILIVVTTFNRIDLTGLALDSIARHKSDESDVLVIDDASAEYGGEWFKRWPFKLQQNAVNIGVGVTARQRFEAFLQTDHDYLCGLDNDVLVTPRFDLILRALFDHVNDHNLTVVSGYHSNTQQVKFRTGNYVETTSIGGICQFVDRATAQKILERMPVWDVRFDAHLSAIASKMVVPRNSIIQHTGIHGTGVNGRSTDEAVGFPY